MIEYSTSNPAEVINKFLCPVCQDVVYRPKMTPCEHIFCFKCIKLWLETSQTCPVCRQLIDKNGTTNPPKAFQEELLKLKVKCTFREKGCSDEIDLKSLQKHERTCKFKGPRCHSSICKRPLHQTEEADLVYPVKRMKFCCKSCLEEHVMHNYLLPIKRLKMWEELKKEYSACKDFGSEKEFFRKMSLAIAQKIQDIEMKVTEKINLLYSVDDRYSAVVESEEEKEHRWNLLVMRMLDAVVAHTSHIMPDSDIRLEAKSIGELSAKLILIHYSPRFEEPEPLVLLQDEV